MGVDLGDLVTRKTVRLQDLRGKIVAIDAYNTLYQFLSIIRQPDGTPLQDSRGNVTSHLAGLLYRTANFAEAGIKPVYVYDGMPHERKMKTLEERKARKVKAEADRKEAVAAGDTARAYTKATQTAHLSRPMADESRELLDALGIPWVAAPGEGEAQAAAMATSGSVHAAASQDYDALLFGAPRLLRNMAVTGRRKLPGRNVWVDVEPEMVALDDVLASLGLTREQLVDVGLLVGTDYNDGVRGVGPKRAAKLIKEHGDAEHALAHVKQDVPDLALLRGLFLAPATEAPPPLAWRLPEDDKVVEILVRRHGFTEERVRTALARYAGLAEALKQRSLFEF